MNKLLSLIFLVAMLLTAPDLSAQSAIGQLHSLAGGASVNIPEPNKPQDVDAPRVSREKKYKAPQEKIDKAKNKEARKSERANAWMEKKNRKVKAEFARGGKGIFTKNGKQVFYYGGNKELIVPNLKYEQCLYDNRYRDKARKDWELVALKGYSDKSELCAWYLVNFQPYLAYYLTRYDSNIYSKMTPYEEIQFYGDLLENEVLSNIDYDYVPVKVKQNGRWGITNMYGDRTLVKCKYDDVAPEIMDKSLYYKARSHPLASVSYNPQQYDYYDDKGKLVAAQQQELKNLYLITNGRITVTTNGKQGTVDLDGKTLIPNIYDDIKESYNPGYPDEWLYYTQSDGKKGLVNRNGGHIVPEQFDDISADKGVIRVEKEGKYGMYDYQGNPIFPCGTFDQIHKTDQSFYNVGKDHKAGAVSNNGKLIVPCEYDIVEGFGTVLNNNYILVQKEGKWGAFRNNEESPEKICDPTFSREELIEKLRTENKYRL